MNCIPPSIRFKSTSLYSNCCNKFLKAGPSSTRSLLDAAGRKMSESPSSSSTIFEPYFFGLTFLI